MEQKAKVLKKISALLSAQCVLLVFFIFVALLCWIVFGLRPIQESMVPLDRLHCFVFKLDTLCSTLCSNSAFLLLVCNAIIWALMVLSKSSESPDIYTVYFKESESRRKQVGFTEAFSAGKNWVHGGAEISGCREICSVENVQQLEIEAGDCEEKSTRASSLAVVPFQGDISIEEHIKQCEEFIVGFRRQMSLERQG